jgi:acetyl esterase/lipase
MSRSLVSSYLAAAMVILTLRAALVLPPTAPSFAAEQSPAFSKSVHTYKTVEQLQIQADVYRHECHEDTQRWPVVVWLRGGALIMGSRGRPRLPA